MSATNEDDLVSEILFDEPLFVAAGVQNSLVRRRKIKLAELVNEPWTLPRPESALGETSMTSSGAADWMLLLRSSSAIPFTCSSICSPRDGF